MHNPLNSLFPYLSLDQNPEEDQKSLKALWSVFQWSNKELHRQKSDQDHQVPQQTQVIGQLRQD
jgi:hypothetical protein